MSESLLSILSKASNRRHDYILEILNEFNVNSTLDLTDEQIEAFIKRKKLDSEQEEDNFE